jgi:MFS family permease
VAPPPLPFEAGLCWLGAASLNYPFAMEPEPELAISSISLASYLRLVRENSNFRRLWTAQIVSEIGDWFYSLAIYNLLLEFTGEAKSVALALVLQVIPQTLFGPLSGIVNDRIRRRRVMITSDGAGGDRVLHASGALAIHCVACLSAAVS